MPAYQEDILTMQEDFIIWHVEQEIQEEKDTFLEELNVSDTQLKDLQELPEEADLDEDLDED